MRRFLVAFICLLGVAHAYAQQERGVLLDSLVILKEKVKPIFVSDTTKLVFEQPTDSLLRLDAGIRSALSATLVAGRTASTVDVSASGSTTFSLPIALPPGIDNVVPQVGLFYNSQAGNGIGGYGWNISGLSAVTRIAASKYIDGFVGGVNFDLEDRFALDGQRLLLKSGAYYGADGAEYQTEQYSNIKIISRGVSPYGSGYGPAYFEVHHPDGSKAFYGYTSDSRNQLQYSISYIENPQAIRISYQYEERGNLLYVTQIGYGSQGAVTPVNRIEFSYWEGIRPNQNFVGGISFSFARRVTKISVIANGTPYRHYVPTYSIVDILGYARMDQIQEFDGSESSAFAPIQFTYNATNDLITSQTISNLSLTGIASNNSQIVTGDLTGNGSMDFLLYKNTKDTVYAFYNLEPGSPYVQLGYEVNTGTFRDVFLGTWLTHNSKVLPGQGMFLVKDIGLNQYRFEVYSSGSITPVYYQYDRSWTAPIIDPGYYSYCDNQYHDGTPAEFEFLSGDFNGDGLTDIFALSRNKQIVVSEYPDPIYPWECIKEYGPSESFAYLINMDRRKTSDFVSELGWVYQNYDAGDKAFASDFDGDGRTDILIVKMGSMNVYSLMRNSEYLEYKWGIADSRIHPNQKILMGDYNGDGKMDLMFSTGYNNLFATFMSTGNGFVKHEQYQPFSNVQNTWDGVNTMRQYQLVPSDVNGDGKTDMIFSSTTTYNSTTTGSISVSLYPNTGMAGTQPVFGNALTSSKTAHVKHNAIPIFLNPDQQNPDLEYGYISDNAINLFRFHRNMLKEAQMAQVTQDGVVHDMYYSRLMADSYVNGGLLYETSFDQVFPYVDIHYAPQLYVTNKISRSAVGHSVQQIFAYGKAVTHAEGLGFVGFGELIRSNMHLDSWDNNRNFTIGIQNPQLRGANVRTFLSKSPNISLYIKNMNLTNPPPAGGIADGATITDYITRQDQLYYTQVLPNKTFINVPITVSTKDLLVGTYSNQRLIYDSYYNISHRWLDNNGTHVEKSGITYANSLGTPYYVGRLMAQKDTLQHAADTYTTEQEYSYTGYLPTQIKRKGHLTDFVTDNLSYDAFGNIIQLIKVTPNDGQRLDIREYDLSGRFMTRYVDPDGLATNSTYYTDIGLLHTQTDPYARTATYTYDSFGRINTQQDYLGNTYTESRTGVGTAIHVNRSTSLGEESLSIFNALGQKVEEREKTVLGTMVGRAWQYDAYGRQTAVSEPAAVGTYSQWNTQTFDSYGRLSQSTAYTGKIDTYSYSGLSTSVNDGVRTKVTIRDVVGNIASVQDPGGTVNYTYFANNGLKSADYGGSVQTMEQDGWGRKTKLTDPSAGVYDYEYDEWGQVTKETTPKGYTTYTYDQAGKLLYQSVLGDSTNMQHTFYYNPSSRLLTSSSLANSDGNSSWYVYGYDSYARMNSFSEDNLKAIFNKSWTYNSQGQLDVETVQAEDKDSGQQSTAAWKNHYANGQLEKQTLQGTGQVLWQVDALDARGLLTGVAQAGDQHAIFTYDTYGFPSGRKFDRTTGSTVTLMNLTATFDAVRGFPSARSNSAFGWNETFAYDNMDRLTDFNDNNGTHSQQYDGRGRITENSRLGQYNYTGSSYRQDDLQLNTAADIYYQTRDIQQLSYNAFKSPVEIYEPGHDRISFQYNGALHRSHMYYGGEQADKMLRRYRRHYAQDGSAEITRDQTTGELSFITYLGGDAYSAPAIWKKVVGTSGAPQGLFFLQRDYLGSIVLVTDETGTVMEKRQFDAWGNIVKLTDGSNNNLSNFLILDRGYTGHEHLLSVGLIHMNGRLYDPRLGRFLAPDNYVQDPFGTQNFNRYGYALNNPMVYVDPDGEFIHIIIGAAIGGVVNLVSKAIQGKIHNFGDGLAAFGIGAAGGAVVALTGGAALAATGLTASSIAGGAITGVVGFSTGGMVQNVGNHLYFGDPLMSGKEFAIGLGISAVTGGILGGVSHQIWGKGTSIWTGRALNPRISVGELTMDGVVDTKGNIVSSKPDILPDPIKANYAGEGDLTTVGRWMSKAEYEIMAKTGRMVEGAGGQTFVSTGGPSAFNAAAKGSVYVEFQVSTKSLLQGGQANWFKVLGLSSSKAMQGALQKQGGELLPQIHNLSQILKIK